MLLNKAGDLPISEVFVRERMPATKSKSFRLSKGVSKTKLNKDIIYECNESIFQGAVKLSEWKNNFFGLSVPHPGSNLDAKRKAASQARASLMDEITAAHTRLLRMREKVMLAPTTIWALPMVEIVELINLLQGKEHFDFRGIATAQLGKEIQSIVSSEWKEELNVIYHYVDSFSKGPGGAGTGSRGAGTGSRGAGTGSRGAGTGSRGAGTGSRPIAEAALKLRGPPSRSEIDKRMECLSYVPGKSSLDHMGELLVLKLMKFMKERYHGLRDEVVGIPLGLLSGDAMNTMVAVHIAKYVQDGTLRSSNWLAMTGYHDEDEYLLKMWNAEAGVSALMQVTQDVNTTQLFRDVLLVSLFTPLGFATTATVDDFDILQVWLDLAFSQKVRNFARLGFFIQPDSRIVEPVDSNESGAAGTGSPAAGTGSRAAGTGSRAAGTGSRAAGTGSRAARTESPAAGTRSPAASTESPAAQTRSRAVRTKGRTAGKAPRGTGKGSRAVRTKGRTAGKVPRGTGKGSRAVGTRSRAAGKKSRETGEEDSGGESDLPDLSDIGEMPPSAASGSSSKRKRSVGPSRGRAKKLPRINNALGVCKVCKREEMKTTTKCKVCREHLHHICTYGNQKFGLEHDVSCSCSMECYLQERASNTSLPDPNTAPSLA